MDVDTLANARGAGEATGDAAASFSAWSESSKKKKKEKRKHHRLDAVEDQPEPQTSSEVQDQVTEARSRGRPKGSKGKRKRDSEAVAVTSATIIPVADPHSPDIEDAAAVALYLTADTDIPLPIKKKKKKKHSSNPDATAEARVNKEPSASVVIDPSLMPSAEAQEPDAVIPSRGRPKRSKRKHDAEPTSTTTTDIPMPDAEAEAVIGHSPIIDDEILEPPKKKKKRKHGAGASEESYPPPAAIEAVVDPSLISHVADPQPVDVPFETGKKKRKTKATPPIVAPPETADESLEPLDTLGVDAIESPPPKKKSKKKKSQQVVEEDPTALHIPSTYNSEPSTSTLALAPAQNEEIDFSQYDDPDALLRAIQGASIAPARTKPREKTKTVRGSKQSQIIGREFGASTAAKKTSRTRATEIDGDSPEILYTKWLSSAALKEAGVDYKRGKFTVTESERVAQALEQYRVENGLSHDAVQTLIFTKRQGGGDGVQATFWQQITRQIEGRPMLAVYQYVRRKYNPLGGQGSWTTDEDDALYQAYLEFGAKWELISGRVGRSGSDCRDRYRNHVAHKEKKVSGEWSAEEEAELTAIVLSLTEGEGKDTMNDVLWTTVSERMGHRRTRQQCRIKWQDSLNKRIKRNGVLPRWGGLESYRLVHELLKHDVRDDSEIKWAQLTAKAEWNVWSSHEVQRRWKTLKTSVVGHETLPHSEIMQILHAKYPEPPSGSVMVNGQWVKPQVNAEPEPQRSGRSRDYIETSSDDE